MKKRTLRALALVLSMSLLGASLSGCGSTQTEAAETEESAAKEDEETSEETEESSENTEETVEETESEEEVSEETESEAEEEAVSYFYEAADVELNGTLSEELYYTAVEYLPKETFRYQIYVSEYYEEGMEAALLVQLDMFMPEQCAVMEELVAAGEAPAFIAIALYPGTLEATSEDGYDRYMRSEEFDEVTTDFSNFLVEELIPEALSQVDVTLSDDPDMHMITGGSSGGIAAWKCCWFRNDYFHKTFMASPSFHSLAGGAEFLEYLSKCEPREIRAYLTWGGYEYTGYQGSNWEVGTSVLRMLDYNGYEYEYEYFEDEGHCYGIVDMDVERNVLEFMWADYETDEVSIVSYNSSVSTYVEYGSEWEEIDASEMPESIAASTDLGTYVAEEGTIYLESEDGTRTEVATGFKDISDLAISSDLWRLYITDYDDRYVYVMSILEDGSLEDVREVAPLQIIGTSDIYGGKSICVDTEDHKYVATDIGIQIMSTSVNCVLTLPEDLPVDEVVMVGNKLYARSGDRCFVRDTVCTGREEGADVTVPAESTEYVTETESMFYWDMSNFLSQHPFVVYENEKETAGE